MSQLSLLMQFCVIPLPVLSSRIKSMTSTSTSSSTSSTTTISTSNRPSSRLVQ